MKLLVMVVELVREGGSGEFLTLGTSSKFNRMNHLIYARVV